MDPTCTHRTIEGSVKNLSEDVTILNEDPLMDNETPAIAPTISSEELRNFLVLPPDSGWSWWNPGFKTGAGSPQYLNECDMVNDECVVLKTVKIDLTNWAAHLIIPKLPLIKRMPFTSLRELQVIVSAFHKAPLCLGFTNEKFLSTEKTTVGFFSNGSWKSVR